MWGSMRWLIALAGLVLTACAVTPPKPSMWQLENQCASSGAIADLEACTRNSLDETYGATWRSVPQANAFVDFIGATAAKVARGEITEEDGRLAISNFASQQSTQYQAQQAAQRAAAQAAMTQIGLALMAQQPVVTAKFMIFGGPEHSTYLGCLNCGQYATDSVLNDYGAFGSAYGVSSIRNQFGNFGSPYSTYSACNPYATDPPVIVDQSGNFYGRLTLNAYNAERTHDTTVIAWLDGVCRH